MVEGIAIVSQTPAIKMRDVARGAAAIQTQVLRDLRPAWGVAAPVNCFFRLEDAPLGHWPVVIRDDIEGSEAGIHRLEGNLVAVARTQADWTTEVSRLVLDLLLNPDGLSRVVGPAPEPDHGDVEFVTSVGAAGNGFTYEVHGFPLSDFVYPAYYQGGSGPFSSAGQVTRPQEVAPGGHLTWWDGSTGRWWQQRWLTGDQPELLALDVDADGDVLQQLRQVTPAPAPMSIDLREPAGIRPTGATHRAHRINDRLNRLERPQRSAAESPSR